MTDKTIAIHVLRYRPEQDSAPVRQTYQVPWTDDMSVLQGLQYIKDELDGTLSFRWSCRMAICGSCGMTIDGRPALACKTFLRDCRPEGVEVSPLAHFPIERDLVVATEDFIGKLQRLRPYIVPRVPRNASEGEHLQTPVQLDRYLQFSACINCLLCYAACPQYGLDAKFLGPAAITLAHRYNEDSRDAGSAYRLSVLRAEHGVFSCTAVGYCSEVCPKEVDPANAVNLNKSRAALGYFVDLLTPPKEPS